MKISFFDLAGLFINFGKGYHSQEDYLRYKLRDILAKNPNLAPPHGWLDWATRLMPLPSINSLAQIEKFVNAYAPPIWQAKDIAPALVAKHLRENTVHKYLEYIPVDARYFPQTFGLHTVFLPSIVPRTIFAFPEGLDDPDYSDA